MQIITRGPAETQRLARRLSWHLAGGDILALFGSLGTGKTVFVKGLAKGLGVKKGQVNSPSFVLIREYKGKILLYHVDLYRLKDSTEIYNLGLQDYFSKDAITVIEWAQKFKPFLPKAHLAVKLEFKAQSERRITLRPFGSRYRNLMREFKKDAYFSH